ncbi:hypothetical protein [Phenylobacterium sp. CCH12-B4]|uniref:hypothetical protein n=1 Tax=Phenylobacterium sp. CCH12-B4 TaxID=1768784 RepID=UPI001E30DC86|nr:hypothetical protein [Phenylobacterium sp. CCH12-B4]
MGVYARILLASDGTREGLAALREGALAARAFGAEVYLLIIEREPFAIKVADGIHPLPVRAHLAGSACVPAARSRPENPPR